MSAHRCTSTRGRSSTRAATRPSRSTSRLESGAFGRAAVPSGASTGQHEAVELRDGGDGVRRQGRDAGGRQRQRRDRRRRARARRRRPARARRSADRARRHAEQGAARRERDPRRLARGREGGGGRRGRPALPLARRRRARTTLPVPMMNVINGGAHAQNSIDLQEFMLVPAGADDVRGGAAHRRRDLPRAEGASCTSAGSATAVGDEGGFAPDLGSSDGGDRGDPRGRRARGPPRAHRDRARPGGDRVLPRRRLPLRGPRGPTAPAMCDFYARARRALPDRVDRGRRGRGRLGRVARADRAARRPRAARRRRPLRHEPVERLQRGIDAGVANAILVKVNQIGTLTETLEAIELARGARLRVVISHRSGETEDTTIADLAVATNAGQIKTGAPLAHRPRREVQPAAPHRGGARRPRGVSRLGRVPARSSLSAYGSGS